MYTIISLLSQHFIEPEHNPATVVYNVFATVYEVKSSNADNNSLTVDTYFPLKSRNLLGIAHSKTFLGNLVLHEPHVDKHTCGDTFLEPIFLRKLI